MSELNLSAWCAQRAANFREYEHIEMVMYSTSDDRDEDIVEWVIRCLGNPECDGSAEALELIHRQRAAGEARLRAELAFAREEAKSIYDTCKQIERERDTLREVARGNKRHVATLSILLERVEKLTVSTDGDDIHPDAEIPIGEIRRVLNEPVSAGEAS